MNEQYYSNAWLLYCVAAAGLVLATYWATRWTWRWLRELLCVLVAVILFTPTVVDPSKAFLAPSVIITALDLALKIGNNAWRAVADLALYGIIALTLYVVFCVLRWWLVRAWRRRFPGKTPTPEPDRPTLRMLQAKRQSAADGGDKADQEITTDGKLRTEPRI